MFDDAQVMKAVLEEELKNAPEPKEAVNSAINEGGQE